MEKNAKTAMKDMIVKITEDRDRVIVFHRMNTASRKNYVVANIGNKGQHEFQFPMEVWQESTRA